MKVVVEGNKNVLKLIGKQAVKDVEYRMMQYVLASECEEGVILLNSITGQLVLLNNDESLALDGLPSPKSSSMNDLIENYFLVPSEYNEYETVKSIRYLLQRMQYQKGIESYTILTTTNCNARCFYCYENDLARVNMSPATAEKVVDYMMKNKKVNSLKLHWFGGEPLLCSDRIDQICNLLQESGLQYYSSMTTNGYLFSEQMIEKAITLWNLKSVQITLDGTEEIYNKTKAYVLLDSNPFQRVINNICMLLAKKIRVAIRLNLDKHNMEDLQNLIEYLDKTIDNKDDVEVYSHVLFEDAGFNPIKRNDTDRIQLYSLQAKLNNELEKRGLSKKLRSLPSLKTHCCMADSDNATVIYPDGRLFKCEHVEIGDEYGDIFTGINDWKGIKKYRLTTELPDCCNCALYPSCVLLENCQGKHDKNQISCHNEVECTISSMKMNFRAHMDKVLKNT